VIQRKVKKRPEEKAYDYTDIYYKIQKEDNKKQQKYSVKKTKIAKDAVGRFAWEQGVPKRCRLSWLTNSALVYEPKRGVCVGGGGMRGFSQ
jgi:hypothetical protein